MLISELVSYAAVWGCASLLDKRLTSKSQISAADLGKSENRDVVLFVLSVGHEQNISLQAASFNATDPTFLEAVAAMHDIPAVTVTLAEDVAPNKTIDLIITLDDAQNVRDETRDSRGPVEHFVSHLLMGLSRLPLLGIYYIIFKPLCFALACYGHPLQEDG